MKVDKQTNYRPYEDLIHMMQNILSNTSGQTTVYTPSTSNHTFFQGGFPAQLQFREMLETVEEEKKSYYLIESGGIDHFSHSKN